MRIDYCRAAELNSLVGRVRSYKHSEMNGYDCTERFSVTPFDAAVTVLSLLWKELNFNAVQSFLNKWEKISDGDMPEGNQIEEYISELKELVDSVIG